MLLLRLYGSLGEIEPDSQSVRTRMYMHYCVPRSVRPIFKSYFVAVDEIRLQEPLSAFWPAQPVDLTYHQITTDTRSSPANPHPYNPDPAHPKTTVVVVKSNKFTPI